MLLMSVNSLIFIQVLSAHCWVVFFSPSGVQFVLPLLKSHCDVHTLKVHVRAHTFLM